MNISNTLGELLKFTVISMDKSYLSKPPMHEATAESMVHIWSAQYSDLEHYYDILSSLAGPDELARATGFKKPADARRYILRHGMTRALLGPYLHQEPEKIQFGRGTAGKPELDREANIHNIRFSLSHTDEKVCLGISKKSEIGLDIVKIDPLSPYQETGQYLFSPDEWRWVTQTEPEDRPLRFFRIWSVKEALLKATGSDVNMMKEADVSGIMTDRFLDGFYPVRVGEKEMRFFIHESRNDGGHHCALATIPAMETGAWNECYRMCSG